MRRLNIEQDEETVADNSGFMNVVCGLEDL